MSEENVQKSRRNLLLVIAVFVVPIVLAKLALEQQWFNYGVTNKGQLEEQPLHISSLGLNVDEFDKKWLMIYRLPSNCDKLCLQQMMSVNNTFIALGKETPRVKPIAMSIDALTEQQQKQLTATQWLSLSENEQFQQQVDATQLLIVDPLGNVVMRHTAPVKTELLPPFGKAVLSDMKKLLKYSKIG